MQLVEYDIGHDVILSASECQEIVDWFAEKEKQDIVPWRQAETRKEGNDFTDDYNPDYRQGHTASARGFPYEQEIIDAVRQYAEMTKIRLFRDDWTPENPNGFQSINWQYSIYKDTGDKFNEHQDQSVTHHNNVWYNSLDQDHKHKWMFRKVSCSVQLTAPDQYEGCDLRIRNKRDSMSVYPRTQGSIIVFPSYAHHAVTPLTSGTRYAMVGWFMGPHWR